MPRNAAVDLLKVFLSFMVVGIHAEFLQEYAPQTSYLLVNGLFKIAVPIFFIINGYYLYRVLCKDRSGVAAIFKWTKRILILYLTWSLLYLYFYWPHDLTPIRTLLRLGWTLFTGYFHLWYLVGMIGAGLLMYAIRNIDDRYKIGLMVLLYGIGVFMQYAGVYHLFDDPRIDTIFNTYVFYRNFLFYAFPMFIIGYLLAKYRYHERLSMTTLFTLFAIGSALLLFEAVTNLLVVGAENRDINMLFSVMLFAPALLMLALRSTWTTTSRNLSELSFYIYFIHPFFLKLFDALYIGSTTQKTVFTIVMSILASMVLISISYLRRHSVWRLPGA